MTSEERLTVAKLNLQQLNDSNDELLRHLLIASDQFIKTEGITDDGSTEYDYLVVMYACYLFRKRDASSAGDSIFGGHGETSMPRYLRWALNNLLMKQKGATE